MSWSPTVRRPPVTTTLQQPLQSRHLVRQMSFISHHAVCTLSDGSVCDQLTIMPRSLRPRPGRMCSLEIGSLATCKDRKIQHSAMHPPPTVLDVIRMIRVSIC